MDRARLRNLAVPCQGAEYARWLTQGLREETQNTGHLRAKEQIHAEPSLPSSGPQLAVKDTLSINSRDGVVNHINANPDKAFMVLVSVPSSPACRELYERLPSVIRNVEARGSKVTIIKAEFPDLGSARAGWGRSMEVPHSFLLGIKPKGMERRLLHVKGDAPDLEEKLVDIGRELANPSSD